MGQDDCVDRFECISDRVLAKRWMVVTMRLALFIGSTIFTAVFIYGLIRIISHHACFVIDLFN